MLRRLEFGCLALPWAICRSQGLGMHVHDAWCAGGAVQTSASDLIAGRAAQVGLHATSSGAVCGVYLWKLPFNLVIISAIVPIHEAAMLHATAHRTSVNMSK
jgi:hypothetical protein